MTISRRKFIQACSIPMLSLLTDAQAEWFDDLFTKKNKPIDYQSVSASFNSVFKPEEIISSDQISLEIPLIAENGAVVPVTIRSDLESVQQIIILVEKNPVPIVAVFELSPHVETVISARIKMAATSKVIALLKTNTEIFKAEQAVKVTIGGCGG